MAAIRRFYQLRGDAAVRERDSGGGAERSVERRNVRRPVQPARAVVVFAVGECRLVAGQYELRARAPPVLFGVAAARLRAPRWQRAQTREHDRGVRSWARAWRRRPRA